MGDVDLNLGYTTKEKLKNCLIKQSIADASVEDMESLKISLTSLPFPDFVKPFWDNNGMINDVVKGAKPLETASAAANVGKLIALLSNSKPQIAKECQMGVIAAKNLIYEILNGNS